MLQNYTPKFKKKIIRLHKEDGRTCKRISAEYGVPKPAFPSGAANYEKNAIQAPKSKKNKML